MDDSNAPREGRWQSDGRSIGVRADSRQVDVREVAVPAIERIGFEGKVTKSVVGVRPLADELLRVTEIAREPTDLLRTKPVVSFG